MKDIVTSNDGVGSGKPQWRLYITTSVVSTTACLMVLCYLAKLKRSKAYNPAILLLGRLSGRPCTPAQGYIFSTFVLALGKWKQKHKTTKIITGKVGKINCVFVHILNSTVVRGIHINLNHLQTCIECKSKSQRNMCIKLKNLQHILFGYISLHRWYCMKSV